MRPATLVAYRAFSDLASKGSFFLITVVAAHRLSIQAFGIFSLASAFGWIVGVTTDFGIQLHVARAVARRPGDSAGILRTWLRMRLWTAGAAAAVIAAGVLVLAPDGDYAVPILLFALVYIGGGLIEFLHYFYRGLARSDLESLLTLWQRAATLGCALIALAWRPDPTVLATAMLLPVVATFLLSARVATRLGREATERVVAPPPAARQRLLSEFQRDVLPIGAGIVLSALYFRIDVFLVQLWSGASAVALYNAVFRLVEALRLFPAAVLAVALPSLFQTRDTRLLLQVSVGLTAFAVATSLVLWATADWGIRFLYGAPYAAAVPAFRILILSFPLLSLNYALTHQLIGWDGQRAYATVCGVALLANIGMNAKLIPAFSIEGAAWAMFWTEALLTAGCGFALWQNSTRRLASGRTAPAVS